MSNFFFFAEFSEKRGRVGTCTARLVKFVPHLLNGLGGGNINAMTRCGAAGHPTLSSRCRLILPPVHKTDKLCTRCGAGHG